MTNTVFAQFGRFLRNLRLRTGLSLRQVQKITARIPPTEAMSISHGYLHRLERGRPTKIGIAKLVSLASVYRVPTRELIDAAPASIRPHLEAEFHRWVKDRPVWVEPPPFAARTADAIEQRFDSVLSSRARDVTVPLDDHAAARELFSRTVVTSALPVLIATAGRSVAGPFWRARREQVSARLEDAASASRLWFFTYSGFRDWLADQPKWIDRMGQVIDWWAGDYAARIVTCHFTDADHDSLYGYDRAPIVLVDALRWRQAAALLAAHAPPKLSLPPPPEPIAGLREYLVRLLGDPAGPPAETTAVLTSIIGLTAQLGQAVPALVSTTPSLPADAQESIVRLMAQALPGPAR